MAEECQRCHGTRELHRQDCGSHGFTVPCPDCGVFDYDDDANDCANCGGEGFTYGCDWEWQCDTWDGDSCLCTRRCEWCTEPTPAEIAARQKMQAVMAAAISDLIAGDADMIDGGDDGKHP